jgi:hypothetical protein
MSALERHLPDPLIVEVDSVEIGRPPHEVYAYLRELPLQRSPIARFLFWLRALPDRVAGRAKDAPGMRLGDFPSQGRGFVQLDDQPGLSFAVGAVGRFWDAAIPFEEVSAETFRTIDTPGLGKVAWELRAEPLGESCTKLTMELRVAATDLSTWRRLRRYYRLIAPFSQFMRRQLLSSAERDLGSLVTAEARMRLPGDELVPDAMAEATHGVTIEAGAEHVWPFLLQMGSRRAGWYSYDLLDNAGRPSAESVVPALQDLKVGDLVPATIGGDEGFVVARLEAPRLLVLTGLYDLGADAQVFDDMRPEAFWHISWAFVLESLGPHRTRLHVRARAAYSTEGRWRTAVTGLAHELMQSKQLEGLKERAERHARQAA